MVSLPALRQSLQAVSRYGDSPLLTKSQLRFLLKYVSRDEVELLQRGNGGVVEIRDAISQYLELSPLYGFIQYRRRKILLKYLPEKTSRLVQGNIHLN